MVLLLINSCKKDTAPTPNNNLTDFIKEAKVFIEQQNTTTLSQKNKLGAELNYIWDKANVFINSDSIKTVEIPLAFYKKGYVLGDRNPKAAMASITRLVVKKDKNGELTAFLMTIVPDANYLANKKDDITKNTYHKKTPAFSGLVFYQKQDGTFIGGQRYERGKMTGILTPISDNELNAQVRSQNKTMKYEVADDDCNWYTMWDYTAVCYVSDADIICEWNGEIRWNFKVCSEGGGTISPIGGGTSAKEIKDSVQNPCIKAQLSISLTVKTTILNMLNNTFGGTVTFEDLSLTFKDVTTLPNNIDGTEKRLSGIEFEINLNKNILPNASNEYTLATIYHEMLHAFLSSKLTRGTDGQFQNLTQHTQMANEYVTLISGALHIAYPNISNQEAWALSWGGLQETPFYISLTQAQKDTIVEINSRHRSNTVTNKLGTRCTP